MQLATQADRLPIHGNFVPPRVDFCAEFLNGLAINRDMPGADELFAGAPGGDAAFREIFLKTNQAKAECGRQRA